MWTALTVVIVVAMVLVAVDRWLKPRQVIQERRVALEEKKNAPVPAPENVDPMPPVLMSMAQSESEGWAVIDSLKAFQEGRTVAQSWNPVAMAAINNARKAERWPDHWELMS